MDHKEDYKSVMNGVQRVSQLKRAYLLHRILKNSPFLPEPEKRRIELQIEHIRIGLKMEVQLFHQHLQNIEVGKTSANSNKLRKEGTLSVANSRTGTGSSGLVASSLGSGGGRDLENSDEEVIDNRKRYCLNKKCKFSFSVGKSFKKSLIKRCMRCGSSTVFIIDSENLP